MKLFVISLLFGSFLLAQSGSSTITGTVKDATGLVLPGARISVSNTESGAQLAITSNEVGIYRAGSLVPGAYRLQVEAEGFQKLVRGPVTVEVGQAVAVDLTLELGKATETVTVTESAPLTETQSSNFGQIVSRQMVAGLPLPNRAASSLAALSPGVVMIDSGAGTAENYPVFSVAGGRARNQNFTLDGGNVSNAVGLTRPQQLTSLPVDAMQEFQVIANNYAAEFGHSTGGIVTMTTRSGTNTYHGSVFESLQNDMFNARNFFAAKRAPVRLNQYGGSFGGPIRKDKTHFFATWERTRQLTSFETTSTVPTLLNRNGDFSDLRSTAGKLIAIYDPATGSTAGTRLPFAGNVIPASRFDTVAKAAMGYFPLPNRVGTGTNANNFIGGSRNGLNRDIVVGRLDHQLRQNDLLTARYYINDANTNNTGTYGNPAADPLADITDVRVQTILGSWTHVFRSNLTNDFRYTFLRRKFLDTRPGFGENLAGKLGLTGVSDAAFPAFTIPGYGVPAGFVAGNVTVPTTGAALGNPTAVYRFQTPILDQQFLDSLQWVAGRHALKFGGEYRMGANDEVRDRGSAGNFTISPLITDLPGSSSTTGNSLASFLLGEVNAASIQVSDKIPSRASYLAVYAQDDWRVSDRLTINAELAVGSGISAEGCWQQDELVRSAGDESGVGDSGCGDVCGGERDSGAGFCGGLQQLWTAVGVCVPGGGQAGDGDSRWWRLLLWADGEQHDWGCGFAGVLDFGQLLSGAGGGAEFAAASEWVSGVHEACFDAGFWGGAGGAEGEYFGGVLQPEAGGSDLVSVQPECAAGDREGSAAGGRVYCEHQPSLDGERFESESGGSAADDCGVGASGTAFPAVQ